MDLSNLSVGDVVWYVPRGIALAIRCRIVEVDDWARRQHPQGTLFYWIDEPVGHGLCDDEVFSTKEDALEFLKAEHGDKPPSTLAAYREQAVKFIVSTHDLPENDVNDAVNRLLQSYPIKDAGEWLTLD